MVINIGIANTFYINSDSTSDLMSDYGIYIGTENGQGLSVEELLPESQDSIESSPSRDGAYFFNKTLTPRKIQIPCYTKEEGLSESEKLDVQKLTYIKTPKKLIFDSEPYKYIYIVSDSKVDFRYLQHSDGKYKGFFILNYICYDPVWQSYYNSLETYDTHDYNSIYGYLDVLKMDVGTSVHVITTATSFDLYNIGNYKSPLILALSGSGTTISITNVTRNENLVVTSITNTGICCNSLLGNFTDQIISTSQLNTASTLKTNCIATGSDFIFLDAGSNSFTVSGTNLNLTAKFLYNHTFL